MKKLPKIQSGQALLVILLVMSIGLTVSLGLLSRTTTDIKLSRQFEESSRALSAAEAGVEEALRTLALSGSDDVEPGVSSYSFEASDAGQGVGPFSLGKIFRENVGTVWLANYGTFTQSFDGDTITLCWQKTDTDEPDLEAIVLYKEDTQYKVKREFFLHGLSSGGSKDCGDSEGSKYPYKTDFSLPSGGGKTLLALRLKPIGGDAFLAVHPPDGRPLPSQGKEVVSTGKVGLTVRKVRAIKSYPAWPEIFDHVLFSGETLVKE